MSKNSEEESALVEKLKDGSNFHTWKFQVRVLLKARDLYKLTTVQTETADRKDDFERKDAQAQKVIITTIEKGLLIHIIDKTTAYEMWTKLCSIYERDSSQRKCNLLQEFFMFSFDKNLDVATNVSNLQSIAYRLKALNSNVDDEMIISKILTNLPSQYKHFISAWESATTQEKTLEKLIARLLNEEQRNSDDTQTDAVAFNTTEKRGYGNTTQASTNKSKGSSNKEKKCFACSKIGHFQAGCPNKEKEKPSCSICKKNNHAEKDCYFRKKEERDKSRKGVTFLTTTDSTRENRWIVDSGATTHMTNNKDLFKNIQRSKLEIGIAKQNEYIESCGTGSIEFL